MNARVPLPARMRRRNNSRISTLAPSNPKDQQLQVTSYKVKM